MMKKRNHLLLSLYLFCSMAFAANNLFDLTPKESEFLTVDQAFSFNFLQTAQNLSLSWEVAPEHYLYRDKIHFSLNGVKIGQVSYPPAKPFQDPYFGEVAIYDHNVELAIPLLAISPASHFEVTYQGCAKAGLCYPPKTQTVFLTAITTDSGADNDATLSAQKSTAPDRVPTAPAANPQTDSSTTANWFDMATDLQQLTQWLDSESLPMLLVIFFVIGLGLAFTPCVYPMFPILSRIIVGQQSNSSRHAFKLSFIYVQGMAITYMLLGVIVAFVGSGINATLQQPVVLIPIALLFVFLSLSMFGVINLALPNSWQQKLNHISEKQKGGKATGVFIMGAISALVCSPCATAPLVAAIGYIAQTQDLLLGGMVLYSLAIGMGVPLLIIGTGGVKLLPKAGPWMEVVKAFFGFALLSVAILFIERLLPAQVSIILWSGLTIAAITYLYHQNSKSRHTIWKSVRHIVLQLLLILCALFIYNQLTQLHSKPVLSEQPSDNIKPFILVNNVEELEAQLAIAAQQGKTVMLDYYADWCSACIQFKQQTFPAQQVQQQFTDLTLLKVDVTNSNATNNALLNRFSVLGLPSMIFIYDQTEIPNSRVSGFMDATRFNQHLADKVKKQ